MFYLVDCGVLVLQSNLLMVVWRPAWQMKPHQVNLCCVNSAALTQTHGKYTEWPRAAQTLLPGEEDKRGTCNRTSHCHMTWSYCMWDYDLCVHTGLARGCQVFRSLLLCSCSKRCVVHRLQVHGALAEVMFSSSWLTTVLHQPVISVSLAAL